MQNKERWNDCSGVRIIKRATPEEKKELLNLEAETIIESLKKHNEDEKRTNKK